MMKSVLYYLFNLALHIGCTIAAGFIFSKVWTWFIVATFPGTPPVHYLNAIGIMAVFHFLLLDMFLEGMAALRLKDEDNKPLHKKLVKLFFIYPIVFLTMYCWHLFIQ